MNTNKTTLYFERAGMDLYEEHTLQNSDLENHRIRTAFRQNGNEYYLDCFVGTTYAGRNRKKKVYDIENCGLIVDAFIINGEYERIDKQQGYYTKAEILKFLNAYGVKFDEIIILPNLAGYRVHADNRGYNLSCDFEYNIPRTEQAERIRQYFYDFEKNVLGKQYPNFSCYWQDDALQIIIHYNCYNDKFAITDLYNYGFDYQMPSDEILADARAKAREIHGSVGERKVVGGKI